MPTSLKDSLDLYIDGYNASQKTKTAGLFVHGGTSLPETIDLFVDGIGIMQPEVPLFITAPTNLVNTYTNLYIGSFLTDSQVATLFLLNTQTHLDYLVNIPLFIKCEGIATYTTLPLVVYNIWVGGNIPLMTRGGKGVKWGRQGWPGYVPMESSVPLVIQRPNVVEVIPLFCKALDNPLNTYTYLYILSTAPANANIPLVVPEVIAGKVNRLISLFVEGMNPVVGNIPLAMPNVYNVINGYINLVCHQESIKCDEYCYLYTYGITDIVNENINLVIPEIYGIETKSNILFIRGW